MVEDEKGLAELLIKKEARREMTHLTQMIIDIMIALEQYPWYDTEFFMKSMEYLEKGYVLSETQKKRIENAHFIHVEEEMRIRDMQKETENPRPVRKMTFATFS